MTVDVSHQQISQQLDKYGRFGVHLGLERIQKLLAALGNPQQRVPIIHVAGTNGKGSVCAYLSSVLTQAGYRVGRYTSPHLVSWCERICVNEQPIAPDILAATLAQVEAAIASDTETPTQFEVLTAAAWLFFAQQAVDIAVIEVGLGGRLDATNVVDAPLVSVITSLSREHWQRLGPTLADIAGEKAGVLKPGCPAVIGPLPAEAEAVVMARSQAVGCPVRRPPIATLAADGWATYPAAMPGEPPLRYRLPFLGAHQQINSAIAIATLEALRDQGWRISNEAIQSGMAQARWPGRLQWLTWSAPDGQPYPWLIDGAHNPAAALTLRQYRDDLQRGAQSPTAALWPLPDGLPSPLPPTTTWLMGMLSTKDHADVLRVLLLPGDRLHLVPVPGHATMPPAELQAIAQQVCPQLASCTTYDTLSAGLAGATADPETVRVLCGSLYLIGHFFQTELQRNG
ncbi:bifunctional folylpolyglutamate synthase/dihydrofolate synthase [Leptolyngbya iicbica]|uniref:tetrahydrofolate synthase n=2 Tax=Cyanophyceae TaxID=3028117 RepID=A0A4Q7E3F4_9CYAN|nr:folylpolyglutamate synthase/dihydrofolate synthase family protein [Leptolyngbya sp. LK]RZM76068.1 bifunctional folylpolyglutamate synthase/dihydrofolate synthase [Leptolyngbya sp. LK]